MDSRMKKQVLVVIFRSISTDLLDAVQLILRFLMELSAHRNSLLAIITGLTQKRAEQEQETHTNRQSRQSNR